MTQQRDFRKCQCCRELTADNLLSLWGMCVQCQSAIDRFISGRRARMLNSNGTINDKAR